MSSDLIHNLVVNSFVIIVYQTKAVELIYPTGVRSMLNNCSIICKRLLSLVLSDCVVEQHPVLSKCMEFFEVDSDRLLWFLDHHHDLHYGEIVLLCHILPLFVSNLKAKVTT